MRFKDYIPGVLFAGVMTVSLFACNKENNCDDSSANLPEPVPQTHFRIINFNGNDLLAESTPGHLSFDSLTATQPCHISSSLNKKSVQIGAGGLESYYFYFDNMRQPITGENKECFTLLLNWGSAGTDTIEFISRAEHHVCGITYYLDKVIFNGREARIDDSGNYLLQR